MLSRGKPLAHFYDYYPPEPGEEIVPRAAFAPHVLSGEFEERIYVEPVEPDQETPGVRGVYHVLYARSDEAWRIDAYIAMQFESGEAGWSERFERLQGTLLGYTDRENDLHIEQLLAGPMAERWPWLRRLVAERARGR